MIHEEICTYEVCKLAKEKGFPQAFNYTHFKSGLDYYNHKGELNGDVGDILKLRIKHNPVPEEMKPITAPTKSLLQRWLREERGIVVEVIAQPTCSTSKKNCYWWSVKQNSNGFCYQYEECSYLLYSDEGYFDTYELALEDALKYALEHLIQ